MKHFLFIFFTSVAFIGYSQSNGSLFTKITDAATGETLAGVTLEINGLGNFSSDLEGNFNLNSIPPGTYTIKCNFLSYSEKTIIAKIINGEVSFLKIELEDTLSDGISQTAKTVTHAPSLSSRN